MKTSISPLAQREMTGISDFDGRSDVGNGCGVAVLEKGMIDSGRSWQIETISALEFVTVDQLVRLHDVHKIVLRLQDYDSWT